MRDWKEIAKTNRFVAAVDEIREIGRNENPINTMGHQVDIGIAIDMYVKGHNIDLRKCFNEYNDFMKYAREINFKMSIISDGLK